MSTIDLIGPAQSSATVLSGLKFFEDINYIDIVPVSSKGFDDHPPQVSKNVKYQEKSEQDRGFDRDPKTLLGPQKVKNVKILLFFKISEMLATLLDPLETLFRSLKNLGFQRAPHRSTNFKFYTLGWVRLGQPGQVPSAAARQARGLSAAARQARG